VEQQFKLRGIPYTHVNPTNGASVTTELAHIQSSLARSVPALCVQSSDILSGAPAAEAAMPNIRVIPLNWWSDKKAQVSRLMQLVIYCANNSYAGRNMCQAQICSTADGEKGWREHHSAVQEDNIRYHRGGRFVSV
jgi:hypothetical protein